MLVGKSSVTDYLSHYNMCYDAAIIIWFLVANGREEVSILVMGGPGTGKSTLINGLFGKEKAIATAVCMSIAYPQLLAACTTIILMYQSTLSSGSSLAKRR